MFCFKTWFNGKAKKWLRKTEWVTMSWLISWLFLESKVNLDHFRYSDIHSTWNTSCSHVLFRFSLWWRVRQSSVSPIDHFRIVSIRPGWAHSQRRVGVNITIPLHWPSCEWTLTLPIFLVFVRYGLFYNQGTSSVSFLVKNEMFCNSTTCFVLCYE